MCRYKHVLVATDDDPQQTLEVVEAVRLLARLYDPRISIVHPIHSLTAVAAAYQLPSFAAVEDRYEDRVREDLRRLGQSLGAHDGDQKLRIGSFRQTILQETLKQAPDLVVLSGKHHKLTPESLLHHAQCDILAVRS